MTSLSGLTRLSVIDSVDMGPTSNRSYSPATAQIDHRLTAVRAEFPEWDIFPVFGGYEAVPKGVTVLRSVHPDGIAEKIRSLDDD